MKIRGTAVARYSIILVLLLVGFFTISHQQAVQAVIAPVDDKHADCVICHRTPPPLEPGSPAFPEGIDPSSLCLDCHHYSENHHPVNIVPKGMQEDSTELNSFPLFEGEIRCLTCHEAHGGKPKLLRGGPYSDRRGICFQCHTDQEYANLNPHKMIDGQGAVKKINGEPACLFCHTTLPDATATAENITFKADVAFLCWRCHPPMQGDFFKSHFLVKPSRKAMRQMRKIEREMNVSFPLLNRDRITCSTCHNPHQKGVIVKGPAKAGEDEHDRLRMPPQMICYGCHYNK